jgi:hypothetical protein
MRFQDYVEKRMGEYGLPRGNELRTKFETSPENRIFYRVTTMPNLDVDKNDFKALSENERVVLAGYIPFIPRSNIFYVGVNNHFSGRGQKIERNAQFKYPCIALDKFGFEFYDPKDVEIFDTEEQAKKENSWVIDPDLRRKIIEAALFDIPHFKKEK